MSYRVGTEHYNLPQTEGTDKRDWFDTNEAFRNVDADLHSAVEGVGTQGAQIEAIQTDVGNVKDDIININGEIDGIKTKQNTDEENIALNAQGLTALSQKVDALDTDLAEMIEVTEEPSATATLQHIVGTYFRYNDNLYITTVLIRVGDEIVPDVNCETTDVMTRVWNLEQGGGGSVSADAVSFDNTGTDLVSTNVEDVVKEVNNKLPSGSVIDDTTTSTDSTWSSTKISTPVIGDTRYNTTSNKMEYYDGTTWQDIPAGGGSMVALDFGNPVKTFSSSDTYTAQDGDYLHVALLESGRSGISTSVQIDGTPVCKALYGSSNNYSASGSAYTQLLKAGQVVTTDADFGNVSSVIIVREA